MTAEAQGTKSARTRERILDAAAQVLSRKGYAGTRLVDVADAAGVQAPAIYYYFASRDELVEEVMWAGAHRVRVHVEETIAALPAGATPLDRILAAVDAHVRYELQISDRARLNPALARWFRDHHGVVLDAVGMLTIQRSEGGMPDARHTTRSAPPQEAASAPACQRRDMRRGWHARG